MYTSDGEPFSGKKAWLHLQHDILMSQASDISVDLGITNKELFYATVTEAGKAFELKLIGIVGTGGEGVLLLQNGVHYGTFFDLPSLNRFIANWSAGLHCLE